MQGHRKIGIFSAIFLTHHFVLVGQDTLRLSLQKAVEIALEDNKSVQMADLRKESAYYGVKEAQGNYLPKLTLSGAYNRNIEKQVIFLPASMGVGGPVRIGADNNYASSLDLSIPLFTPSYSSGLAYNKSNLELQKEVLRGTRQATVNQVKKAYSSYWVALESVKVMEKALSNALNNLESVLQLRLEGRVTEYDETIAKAKVTNAQSNLLQSQSNVVPAANALKNLLNLSVQVTIVPLDTLSWKASKPIKKEESKEWQERNSEIQQQLLNGQLQERQIKVIRAGYYPTLSIVGNYQYLSQENSFELSDYRWIRTNSIGMQAQIPLFKGFTTHNKVHQAELNSRVAKEQANYTQTLKSLAYEELLSRLSYTSQRIKLQEENKALSAKALEIAKERYNYGRATLLEVNDAELSLTLARINWLQAQLDHQLTYYDFELLTGMEEQ